jgi:predicted amidophosphoribosyltransferase
MDVGPSLLVYSTSLYSSTASSILLSSKESGIRAADFVVKELISHSLDFYLSSHPADFLVPIPSRASMNRKRGRSYMAAITEELAHSHSIPLLPLLHHGRAVRDQSSISRQLRRNNLEGALVVDSRVTVAAHSSALLIDDLVTTGATLAEAARALRYAGIEVTAGVTAFVAKPLR